MSGPLVPAVTVRPIASRPSHLSRSLLLLLLLLAVSALIALWAGYQPISLSQLRSDETARSIFFRLRLPRVLLAAIIGATLAMVGGALQAIFRNPLAEPFTLGVSGGGALGASVAIAFGWGARMAGVPLVFLAAFAGAAAAVALIFQIAESGATATPGALLLAGVVVNLVANAAVLTIEYMVDPNQSLQILRWLVGSLDIIGYGVLWRMLLFLAPGWALLLFYARELHLIAVDEEAAVSLGVDVRVCERAVYIAASLLVGVTVAVGGNIGFVGLMMPHVARLLFGQDVRIVLPCSFLLGAAFLMLTDAIARTALGQAELPVGAITGLLGGPFFLFLMRRERRYAAL